MKKVCVITTVHRPKDTRVYYREMATFSSKYKVDYVVHAEGESDFSYVATLYDLGSWSSRPVRILHGFSAFRHALKSKADLYLFHDPEFIPFALILRSMRKKVVYDAHEVIDKDILDKNWIPTTLRRPLSFIAKKVEELSFKKMSGVISPYPPNIKEARKVNKIPLKL
jgi:hypothetical protein